MTAVPSPFKTDSRRPPLKSATVFGGIATVVHTSEPVDSEELGHLPSINAKSKEVDDMQDMYRRILAASWTSRAGALPADRLVEELFSGSWSGDTDVHNSPNLSESDHSPFLGTEAAAKPSRSSKRLSPSFQKRPKSASSSHSRDSGKTPDTLSSLGRVPKGGSIEQQLYDGAKGRSYKGANSGFELSEFDVREDLRSWDVAGNEEQST